jgi:hypothetical protein
MRFCFGRNCTGAIQGVRRLRRFGVCVETTLNNRESLSLEPDTIFAPVRVPPMRVAPSRRGSVARAESCRDNDVSR